MTRDLKFVTSISTHTKNGLVLRDESLSNLIHEADFVSTLFLSIVGRKPENKEKILLNAILVAGIDHGINPASAFVPRVVASSGNSVFVSMATALLSLGKYHGGAVTGAMKLFKKINDAGDDIENKSDELVEFYLSNNKIIPGFGHPIYKEVDPRTRDLFDLARKNNFDIEYMNIAKQLEHTIEEKFGKRLVLNIDGSIAALLMTMKIDPLAGNAIFGISRVVGSIAHILEEENSGNWVRRINDEDIEYKSDKN